ncbi:MAG: DUF1800 domain-containing protein [bacterium]|nr:DUF1800 domain-containing protein [bacterium]
MRHRFHSRVAPFGLLLLALSATAPAQFTQPELELAGHVGRRVTYGLGLGDYGPLLPTATRTQDQQINDFLTEQITGISQTTGLPIPENAEANNILQGYPIPINPVTGEAIVGWSAAPPITQFGSTLTIEQLSEINITYKLFSAFPLRERLTEFFQDLFNSNYRSLFGFFRNMFGQAPYAFGSQVQIDAIAHRYATYFYWEQNDHFRANATGTFFDLLNYNAKHPSMLVYLNGVTSEAPTPDQNYGREFLELHTCSPQGSWVGPGGFIFLPNYFFQDVLAASRIFSGWSIQDASLNPAMPDIQFLFKPTVFTGGLPTGGHFASSPPVTNTMFAQTFTNPLVGVFSALEDPNTTSEGDALLMHMANSPATAEFISRKLYRLFISEVEPPPADPLIFQCVSVWGNQGGNISNVLAVLLTSPQFRTDTTIRFGLARRPIEVMGQAVALMEGRAFDGTQATTLTRMSHVREMKERVEHKDFHFPTPDGPTTDSFKLHTTLKFLGSTRFKQELYSHFTLGTAQTPFPFLEHPTTGELSLGYDYLGTLGPVVNFADETSITNFFALVAWNNRQTGADWGHIWNFLRTDLNGVLTPTTLALEFAAGLAGFIPRLTSGITKGLCHTLNQHK